MNKFVAVIAAILLATPAMAAPSLTGEVRFGDMRSGRADSTEYKIEYGDTYANVNYGGEFTVKQPIHQGVVASKISLKVGPVLPEVLGFKPGIYGEFGENFKQNSNFGFWGVGAKISHVVYGPVSASVGYRHRQGLDEVKMYEDRLNAGFAYTANKTNEFGIQYYRTRSGGNNADVVGLLYTHKF